MKQLFNDTSIMETKIQEIMGLVLHANKVSKRAFFLNFSGHVNRVQLRVTPSKDDYEATTTIDAWMNEPSGKRGLSEMVKTLNEAIEESMPIIHFCKAKPIVNPILKQA